MNDLGHPRSRWIKAVVFDVGGVLCPNPMNEFEKVDTEYGLPIGTVQSFLRGGSLFAECEVGRLPIAEFYAQMAADIAQSHQVEVPPARLDSMLSACVGDSVRPEMLELLKTLKAGGYQTGLLTNLFPEKREWLRETFPPSLIDVYGESYELGLRKPDPAIYHRLLEMLGREPSEVVFVDDFSENLVGARKVGILGIDFVSPEQARSELATAGVAVAG
ncbi:MAG TPA: HAD family phosphatase [Pseudonocardia sp.]|nr:HAD family phosphatase [Pseudonocardia sp.]